MYFISKLQIKYRELLFPFQCGKIVHRTIIELKHLTSWTVCISVHKFVLVSFESHLRNCAYCMLIIIDVPELVIGRNNCPNKKLGLGVHVEDELTEFSRTSSIIL